MLARVEESERLLAATVDADERALLLFALHTGARWGEQRVVEWGDVDWVNRLVVIRRSMPDGTDTAAPTKSGKEWRIPLTDTLAAALKSIRGLRHLQGGLKSTAEGMALGDVLVAVDGERVASYDDLYNAIDQHKPGDQVEVAAVRDGRPATHKVEVIAMTQP